MTNDGEGLPNDIRVKEQNQSLVTDRILEQNETSKQWKKIDENLGPIIQKSVTPLASLSSPPASEQVSSPDSVPEPTVDPVVKALNESVSPNYVNKAVQMYLLLKDLKGVKITPTAISVNGKNLFGLTATNIGYVFELIFMRKKFFFLNFEFLKRFFLSLFTDSLLNPVPI